MEQVGVMLDFADVTNIAKIRYTWHKEWKWYLAMAQRDQKRADEN